MGSQNGVDPRPKGSSPSTGLSKAGPEKVRADLAKATESRRQRKAIAGGRMDSDAPKMPIGGCFFSHGNNNRNVSASLKERHSGRPFGPLL